MGALWYDFSDHRNFVWNMVITPYTNVCSVKFYQWSGSVGGKVCGTVYHISLIYNNLLIIYYIHRAVPECPQCRGYSHHGGCHVGRLYTGVSRDLPGRWFRHHGSHVLAPPRNTGMSRTRCTSHRQLSLPNGWLWSTGQWSAKTYVYIYKPWTIIPVNYLIT